MSPKGDTSCMWVHRANSMQRSKHPIVLKISFIGFYFLRKIISSRHGPCLPVLTSTFSSKQYLFTFFSNSLFTTTYCYCCAAQHQAQPLKRLPLHHNIHLPPEIISSKRKTKLFWLFSLKDGRCLAHYSKPWKSNWHCWLGCFRRIRRCFPCRLLELTHHRLIESCCQFLIRRHSLLGVGSSGLFVSRLLSSTQTSRRSQHELQSQAVITIRVTWLLMKCTLIQISRLSERFNTT